MVILLTTVCAQQLETKTGEKNLFTKMFLFCEEHGRWKSMNVEIFRDRTV